MKKNSTVITKIVHVAVAILTAGFVAFLYFVLRVSAFNGPSASNSPAGTGAGAIGIGAANNISIGTTTSAGVSEVLIVSSSTNSTEYALKALQPNGSPIMLVRNDGTVSIGTTTNSSALTVAGTITATSISAGFTGTVAAPNITSGLFGSGSFAFPGSLAINTSTNASIPAALTVYGTGQMTNLTVTSLTSSIPYATSTGAFVPLIIGSGLTLSSTGTLTSAGATHSITVTTTTLTEAKVVDQSASVFTNSNTNTTTTFYSYTIPGNTLGSNGSMYRISMQGAYFSNGLTTHAITMYLVYGGIILVSKATAAIPTSTGTGMWSNTFEISNASGTTGKQLGNENFSIVTGSSAGSASIQWNGSSSVDSTLPQTLQIWATTASGSGTSTMTVSQVTNELVGATTTVVTNVVYN